MLVLAACIVLLSTACSATPSWISTESAESLEAQSADTTGDEAAVADEPPAALAFVEPTATVEPELVAASDQLCEASANTWIHSAALNMVDAQANPELSQIALANVAEWLERSTLTDDDGAESREAMFAAFSQLQAMVGEEYDFDWQHFQASTAYANDAAAQTYEAERTVLVQFLNERCAGLNIAELRSEAQARVDELTENFSAPASSVAESESLPGHSIFTHASGRLIASFPTAWTHEEGRSDAIVDLIASPDIDRFLAGDVIDGVRLQLRDAATMAAFKVLLDETMIGSSCERTNELIDRTPTRRNITQTFDCTDHSASIIGQYSESIGAGLIIEASFDRVEASRADLIRLASIANSALWG